MIQPFVANNLTLHKTNKLTNKQIVVPLQFRDTRSGRVRVH